MWFSSLAGKAADDPRLHETQKPLDLMQQLVRDFTDRGDLIIDPFGGSGSTGEAAYRSQYRPVASANSPLGSFRFVRSVSGGSRRRSGAFRSGAGGAASKDRASSPKP